jgi:hypothetical protein
MNSDTKALVGGDNFTINPLMTSGLTLFVRGGKYLHASQGLRTALGVILTLTASATNYVEMDDNGVITSNTTGFTRHCPGCSDGWMGPSSRTTRT